MFHGKIFGRHSLDILKAMSMFNRNIQNVAGNTSIVRNTTTKLPQTNMQNNSFTLAFGIVFSIISLISCFGGLFVWHVVRKHKLLKNTVWVLLLLLTASDSLNAAITIPTYIIAYIDDSILQMRWMCNFSTFVSIFFAHTTIYAIAAISVCRKKVMEDPYISLNGIEYKSVARYVVFAIVISASLSIPPVLGFGEYGYERGKSWCTFRSDTKEVRTQNKVMISLICVFGYIIPTFIIVYSGVKTYLAFRRTGNDRLSVRGRSAYEVYMENWRMAKLMMFVIVAFLIFWTPIVIYLLTIPMGIKGRFWQLWGHIAHLVMFMQGFINPFLYTCKHKSFKEEIKKLFQMCKHPKHQTLMDTTSVRFHSFSSATTRRPSERKEIETSNTQDKLLEETEVDLHHYKKSRISFGV